GRSHRRRGARRTGRRRPWAGAGRGVAAHDLRLPDIPPGDPGRREGPVLTDQDSQDIGSVNSPLTMTSQCRWQPVDEPVVPTLPICSPPDTVSPALTANDDRWL